MKQRTIRLAAFAALLAAVSACAAPPEESRAKAPAKTTVAPEKADIVAHPGGPMAPAVRVDARDYPFSAIGRLNLGGSGYCSAVLVAPDLVLSPAGCLYNRTEGRWWQPVELFFQAGYQFEKAAVQSGVIAHAAPDAYRPGKRLTLTSAQVDFALVKLKKPIGNRAGWLGLTWNDDELEDARLGRRA